MRRANRLPDVTLRIVDRSAADELDLDGTAARLGAGGRRRLDEGSPADVRRFLVGRALITRTVSETFGVAESLVIVSARCADCGLEHGRPTVDIGGPTVAASVSHTTTSTAVAISSAPSIGIDLERLDPRRFAGVEGVVLSPAELRRWSALPGTDRLRALAEHWTMKEAIVKALGTGLRMDPATVELPQPTEVVPVEVVGRRFVLSRPELAPGLLTAVAVLVS
ncbi:MAG TPA: 4'-phosphopantetheinyl transferase superfamily protein [Plantibacter sp.]|nr:4'-phosphopantetheinyl transferase superfamily protein [Plantibacter sp.]